MISVPPDSTSKTGDAWQNRSGNVQKSDFSYGKIPPQAKEMEAAVLVGILTVVEQLKSSGDLEKVGGVPNIVQLTNQLVSPVNIVAHARIIQQKFM